MSEFKGSRKVRCIDCVNLQDRFCATKDTVVAPRKKRVCGSYAFTGTYQNRTPLPVSQVPYVDKSTRRMIKKLLNLGILQVRPDGTVAAKQQIEIPQSTATAAVLSMKPMEDYDLAGAPMTSQAPSTQIPFVSPSTEVIPEDGPDSNRNG